MGKKLWINDRQYMEVGNRRSINSLLQEIAVRPTARSLGRLNFALPDPDPVLRKAGIDLKTYRGLLCDSQVWSTTQSRKAGVLKRKWRIERGKSSARITRFIENILFDKKFKLRQVITEMLDAPLYGNQPMEIFWKRSGDMILPEKLLGKPMEWFKYNQENELLYHPHGSITDGVSLPPRKFINIRHQASYDNPYGERILSRCFWPVTFKKGGVKFWMTFAEKFGMPLIYGRHRRGEKDHEIDKFLDMLENMVQDGVAVIPEDADVDTLESGSRSSSTELYHGLLTFNNAEISKSVIGQTLTTELSGSTGSFAASQTHMAVREDIIDSDVELVQSGIDELIDYTVELNFGADAISPDFEIYEDEGVDKTQAERDKTLKETGIRFTKEYFINTYGFQEDEIEIDQMPEKAPLPEPLFVETQPGDFSQNAIDNLVTALSPEQLQLQVETIVNPVLDLFDETNNYEEAMEKLVGIYPEMTTEALEEHLRRMIFVSQIWGRLGAENESGD